MKKKDLVPKVAKRAGVPQKQTSAVIYALIKELRKALSEGETVELSGLGVFERRLFHEILGRNPKTGEEVVIPAHYIPKFTFAPVFKKEVDNRHK